MQLIRSRSSLWLLVISLTVSVQAQSGRPPEPSAKIVETNLPFPSSELPGNVIQRPAEDGSGAGDFLP